MATAVIIILPIRRDLSRGNSATPPPFCLVPYLEHERLVQGVFNNLITKPSLCPILPGPISTPERN